MRPSARHRGWTRPTGGIVFVLVVALAWLGPIVAPFDPRLSTGPPLQPPTLAHLFGTNDIGQDLLSQWLWGARASILVGVLVTFLSTAMSWLVGITAATSPRLEAPLVALTDLLLALPAIPLYLLIVVWTGPRQRNVVLALGLLSWPAFARIVRAQVISLRGASYIEAARAMGASPQRIALVHVLPGTLSLLPAKLVLTFRFAIFTEATLAFLGLGDPSSASWGTTLNWAFNYPLLFLTNVWLWWVVPPALAIVFVVLTTTWLSTSLESAFDPHGYRRRRSTPRPVIASPTPAVPRSPTPTSRTRSIS